MKFSIRTLFVFTFGVALVSYLAAVQLLWGILALAFMFAVIGALCGHRKYWLSCLAAGLGGALALWLGLLIHAVSLPFDYIRERPVNEMANITIQSYLRDTFVSQSLFVIAEGMILGIIVASLMWAAAALLRRMRYGRPGAGEEQFAG